jgi:hypothetical protein
MQRIKHTATDTFQRSSEPQIHCGRCRRHLALPRQVRLDPRQANVRLFPGLAQILPTGLRVSLIGNPSTAAIPAI